MQKTHTHSHTFPRSFHKPGLAAPLGAALLLALGCGKNDLPTAVLKGPDQLARSVAGSFDCASSTDDDGRIKSCTFDFGDGTTAATDVQRAMHAFREAGIYVVTLTVKDDEGGKSKSAKQVAVLDNVPPTAVFAVASVAMLNAVTNIDASASFDTDGRIVNYAYDFGDSVTAAGPSLGSVAHTYTETGTRIVSLTVTDNLGDTHTMSRQIDVTDQASANIPPTACFTGPSVATANANVAFDASCSSGTEATLTYLFEFGDDSPDLTSKVVTHSYAQSGTYEVRLTVTATYHDGTQKSNFMTSSIAVEDKVVTVTGVSPSTVQVAGGEWVTITGLGFTDTADTTVQIGNQMVADLTVLDSTRIVARVPAGIAGAATVTVRNANGVAESTSALTYLGGANRGDLSYCPTNALTGTSLGFTTNDDDAVTGFALPFAVPFFDTVYAAGSTAYVATNGYLSLLEPTALFGNNAIASASNPDGMVAAYFDDLTLASGQVYYLSSGTAPNRSLTVQWSDVMDIAGTSTLDFQATLYEGSGDIKLQYSNPTYMGAGANAQSATVGLQLDATTGVQASHNTEVRGMAPGGKVYLFSYSDGSYQLSQSATLLASDIAPADGDSLAQGDDIVITFTRPLNDRTVVDDVSVQLWDVETQTLIPVSTTLQGSKDTLVITPQQNLLWHEHAVTVTTSVRDVADVALSQDPAQVACGATGTETPFTSTFLAVPGTVLTTGGLPNGAGPRGLAIHNGILYVVKDGSNRMQSYSVSGLSSSALSDIGFGSNLWDLSLNPATNKAYVTSNGNGTVRVVNIATPSALATISTITFATGGSNPQGIAFKASASKMFVADNGNDTLAVINTSTDTEFDTNTASGGIQPVSLTANCSPWDVTVASNGHVYTTCDGAAAVNVVADTSANPMLSAVVTGSNSPGGVRYTGIVASPTLNEVYAVDRVNDRLVIISTSTDTVVTTISGGFSGGASPENATITGDGRFVMVADSNNDEVAIFDVVAREPFGVVQGFNGPVDLVTVPGTNQVIVSNNNGDTLAILE